MNDKPLLAIILVTGFSGSGKTTLMENQPDAQALREVLGDFATLTQRAEPS